MFDAKNLSCRFTSTRSALRSGSASARRVVRSAALLIAGLVIVGGPAQAAIPAAERAALVDLYNSTTGAGWTNTVATNSVWTVAGAPGNECTWFGVVCNGTGDAVVELNLTANNLVGNLPASITNLPALKYFRAQQNQLNGSLPALTGLNALQYFDVRNNQLTGTLPVLGSLSALRVFGVENNQIGGSIPPLVGLNSLEIFWAGNNQLTGNLPGLNGLSQLRIFTVNNNLLNGLLPPLTGLASLQTFYAGSNQLTGSIPSLAGLGALQHFRVEDNQLTGVFPDVSTLAALQVMFVRNNQLSGNVSTAPGGLVAGMSALCPNQLTASSSPAWDAATNSTPWSTGCTAPLAGQSLAFTTVPTLYVGGSGTITAAVTPTPGSSAAIVYRSMSPLVCSVDSAGLVTVLSGGVAGSTCAIAADKAGDAAYNSAPQIRTSIVILAPVNGTCGTANGVATVTAPSANLCATGTASAVTTTVSAFNWSCNGAGGGSTASCSAPRAYTVSPSVSGANGTVSGGGAVVYNTSGTVTITPNAGYIIAAPVGGTCGGTLSGNTYTTNPVTADCTVVASFLPIVNGACGSANGVATAAAPSTNLCAAGTASAVSSAVGQFTWSCAGANTGSTASCAAPRTYTVSASTSGGNGSVSGGGAVVYNSTGTVTITPNAGYIIATPVGGSCGGTLNGNTYTTNPVVADCTVVASFLQTINGACGPANGVASAVAPTSNLCSAGSASSVTSAASQFTWTCAGAGGGTTASCAAPRTYQVTASVQGGAGSISPSGPQAIAAGQSLVFTITPAIGNVIVSVSGTCGGTLSGNTYTTNPITSADCSVIVNFALDPTRQIPTLSSAMLLMLMALLVAGAGWVRGQRRTPR